MRIFIMRHFAYVVLPDPNTKELRRNALIELRNLALAKTATLPRSKKVWSEQHSYTSKQTIGLLNGCSTEGNFQKNSSKECEVNQIYLC